jgi:serine/threonine protein kinase
VGDTAARTLEATVLRSFPKLPADRFGHGDVTPMVGRTLQHYRIEAPLGEGGMGVVYRALDTHLDRSVSLKVLLPGLSTT